MNSIELFSGAGGLALGFADAGFKHDWLVERNPDACLTIKANQAIKNRFLDHARLFEGDIQDFNFKKHENKVDLVAGGPPCQPFSLGGKHRGNLDDRDMFPQAIRAVREVKPKAFVFENVRGLLRQTFSKYFFYIYLQLSYPDILKKDNESWNEHLSRLEKRHTKGQPTDLSYKVVYRLMNAADFGVPQNRYRVFMVGFRTDLNKEWSFPMPTHSEERLLWEKWVSKDYWDEHQLSYKQRPSMSSMEKVWADQLKSDYNHKGPSLKRIRTVRDAFLGLPDPNDKKSAAEFHNHEYRGGAKTYAGHTGSVLDEPSKTLKAGDHGVPGGENMVVLDNGRTRYFSAREAARIQTFSDNYIFAGSWTECMRQIGNAVPVKLAGVVAQNVFSHLN